jgi:hypothetical protein
MACAMMLMVAGYSLQPTSPDPGFELEITCRVHYCNEATGFGQQTDLNVRFAVSATPQQIKTAITDKLISYGLSEYGQTITASDIVMFDLSRG